MPTFESRDGRTTTQRLLVAVAGVVYLAALALTAWNYQLSGSPQPESYVRGTRLFGWNPLFWRMTALQRLHSEKNPRPQQAADAFLKALALNPVDQESWEGLADAYTQLAEPAKVEIALRAAARAVPHSPRAAWRLANFFLLQGRESEAIPYLRIAASDASLRTPVFDIAWKVLTDAKAVEQQVLPADLGGRLEYINFLIGRKKLVEAFEIWRLTQPSQNQFVINFGYHLLDVLVNAGLGTQAARVWEDILAAKGNSWIKPAGELLTNGDFEAEITNQGLDWRLAAGPDQHITFDSLVAQSGSRSLRITFASKGNPDFTGIGQAVVVEPSQEYRFRGYIKTEGITTRSGIRFLIRDASDTSGKNLMYTPDRVGSNGWTPQELVFRTGPETTVLTVLVRRLPDPGVLQIPLKGTAWIDNLSLTKIETGVRAGSVH